MSLVESVKTSTCKNCNKAIYKIERGNWVHVYSGQTPDKKECRSSKAKPASDIGLVGLFCPLGTLSICINCNKPIIKAIRLSWFHPHLDQAGVIDSWHCQNRVAMPLDKDNDNESKGDEVYPF